MPAELEDLLQRARAARGALGRSLLAWYSQNRRSLPWRGADAYGVWISEIMLQQTQAATVVPYYTRFMTRFPSVALLAAAPLDEVLRMWSGLGYYARARNLHRAAQIVTRAHGGVFPCDLSCAMTLPGIGRYTAGAILSIAYGAKHAVVDANVTRVLSRVFSVREAAESGGSQRALWSLASALLPDDAPGAFNQALMELGARVCRPYQPACADCPISRWCRFRTATDARRRAANSRKCTGASIHHSAAALFDGSGRVLILQRPMNGLWGGLWELPRAECAPDEEPHAAAARAVRERVGLDAHIGLEFATVRHALMNRRIVLHGFAAVASTPLAVRETRPGERPAWRRLDDLSAYAFASPQTRLLEALRMIAGEHSAGGELCTRPGPITTEGDGLGR